MRKQTSDLVRHYVKTLSENELEWLHSRLSDRFGGDVAEVVQFMSKHLHMDRWLSTSKSANDLYDMVDLVQQYVDQDTRLMHQSRS